MEKPKNNFKLKKSDLSITVILLIGILIVVNFFSYNIFFRFDLTENKIYSISPASKKTVGELKDIVNINAYFSDNLPTQLLTLRQEVTDILGEYAAYSGGKVKVQFISPKDDEATEQELNMKGIPQLTFEVVEKDKRQLVAGYMGLTISFKEKIETIPAIKQNVSDLEYQLTTKIKKVISDQDRVIGFLSSQGSVSLDQGLGAASQELRELYIVRDVVLDSENSQIADDINTLIIYGSRESFEEEALVAINDYLLRGGYLLVALDGVLIGEGLSASANSTGLETLLDKYGIKINNDLVADKRSGVASFSQGFFSFSTPYPFWPQINSDSFDPEYSAVSSLENVILPWASSLTIDETKLSNAQINRLIMSTDEAWVQKDNFQIIPNQIPNVTTGLEKRLLAVAINGEIKNAYPGDDAPENFNSRIIVVGDSDFAMDGFVGGNPDNLNLFLNLVDSLSLDSDLIEIRSKNSTSRPIDESKISDSTRVGLKYFNVFGITAIVIVFGIVRYYARRRSRFIDDL